jgi:hypothetical protein
MGFTRIALARAAALCLIALPALATTFVVPSDGELVGRTDAIVIGTVEGSYVQRRESVIETTYEIRVERSMKGVSAAAGELLRIVSPGGAIGDEGVIVAGAAHFRPGQRALLFLTFDQGRWQPTDMTLGRFLFATSTAGERLFIREVDDAAVFERDGTPHREPVRREQQFLRFIEERLAGRRTVDDYTVEASTVSFPEETVDERFAVASNAAAYPPKTYTDNVSDGTTHRGTRWPNIANGVVFHKRADQNISGASDGGVGAIQSGLAAWTNECGSVINLTYGGTTATASQNFDSVHVVEYNDPQNRIGGSWGGSGTVATTFTSYGGTHQFAGETWWSITDADVVFQNGYTATNSSFATAMTHEFGHGIGWRHSNAHYIRNADYSDAPCNSAVEECTSAAIMNAVSSSAYGFTLQPWDVHAAQAVYPGGSCGGTGPLTPEGVAATAIGSTQIRITWAAVGGATSYDVYRRSPGSTTFVKFGSTTTNTFIDNVSPDTAYLYRVIAVSGGGTSPASGSDLATSVVFTDSPLQAGVVIKAVHLAELRRAVNAVRRLAGLGDASFTDPAQPGIVVKAVHITQLRTALDQARSALGLPAGSWSESVAPGVIIRARHFEEIRERVR